MNSKILLAFVPEQSHSAVANGSFSYIIGGIVALLLMGYLIYTLLKPDKF
jgi:K+-transporting ATPase KdpF subunit